MRHTRRCAGSWLQRDKWRSRPGRRAAKSAWPADARECRNPALLPGCDRRCPRQRSVIQEDKADEREGEITAALGKGVLKLGSVHEPRDVIKHGGSEERLNGFQNEHGAIGAGDGEVAPEKEPELTEDADHSAMLRSEAPAPRPVRRRKTSSRESEPAARFSAEGESQARRRPASRTAHGPRGTRLRGGCATQRAGKCGRAAGLLI